MQISCQQRWQLNCIYQLGVKTEDNMEAKRYRRELSRGGGDRNRAKAVEVGGRRGNPATASGSGRANPPGAAGSGRGIPAAASGSGVKPASVVFDPFSALLQPQEALFLQESSCNGPLVFYITLLVIL
uniref:Uncharacterized protein n=1 Tax=Myotis myotis TaxID=51298 RepID=A0A7J7ZZ39_MYOMY|nr:hypothetical protein mMyoMyo1_009860 [Myotis myotis]